MRASGNSRYGAVVIAATMLISAPAASQQTGTRLNRHRDFAPSVSKLDPASAIRVANAFGQCVAQRAGKGMRKALDLPYTSPEQGAAVRRYTDQFDECLGNAVDFDQLNLSQVLLSGTAAEFFVRGELSRVDLTPVEGMTDDALQKTDYRARNTLEDLGLCVVRRSPARARTFVATRVTSDEEIAAFKAIAPDVGPCVMQGENLTLNRPNLRAVIAYALYRVSSKLGAQRA